MLRQGYEGIRARAKSIAPIDRRRLAEAVDRLIELYTATNQPEGRQAMAGRSDAVRPGPLIDADRRSDGRQPGSPVDRVGVAIASIARHLAVLLHPVIVGRNPTRGSDRLKVTHPGAK